MLLDWPGVHDVPPANGITGLQTPLAQRWYEVPRQDQSPSGEQAVPGVCWAAPVDGAEPVEAGTAGAAGADETAVGAAGAGAAGALAAGAAADGAEAAPVAKTPPTDCVGAVGEPEPGLPLGDAGDPLGAAFGLPAGEPELGEPELGDEGAAEGAAAGDEP